MHKTSIFSALIAAGMAVSTDAGIAIADTGYGYGGYGSHPMMGGSWFMGPMMMLVMVVIMVVAVVLVLKLFGFGGGASAKEDTRGNALAILNERFARGEIDKAEYEDRKKALGG